MSEPKVFGDKCGLGCKNMGAWCEDCQPFYCWGMKRVNTNDPPILLKIDPITHQIERCPQCLEDYPVEVKE